MTDFNSIPEETLNHIVEEHRQSLKNALEKEAAKTAQQRQIESLSGQTGTLSQQLMQLAQDPVRNRKQIAEIQRQMDAAQLERDSLTGTESVQRYRRADRHGHIR